jgi:hypothetical protein
VISALKRFANSENQRENHGDTEKSNVEVIAEVELNAEVRSGGAKYKLKYCFLIDDCKVLIHRELSCCYLIVVDAS